MAIVQSEGVDGLTIAGLARAADSAVGGLYRYFDSKDALLAALQVRAVQEFGAFLGDRLDNVTDPVERIRRAASAWPAFAAAQPELWALVDRSLAEPAPVLSDEAARTVDAAVGEVLGQVAAAFTAAEAQGAMRPGDPVLRTHALWAAVHGAGQFRKRDRIVSEGVRAERVRAELVETLLRGWAG